MKYIEVCLYMALFSPDAQLKGATSRYFELFLWSLKIVVNWKETSK